MALNWRRGPSFNDRATGKFSGSPPSRGGSSFSDRATGKFSGSPRGQTAPRRGGSFSDRATGKFSGSPRATDFRTSGAFGRAVRDTAANLGQGIANTGRKIGRGFVHPFQMLAGSIANNQAHHRYLDEIYGEDKSAALWDQAIRNRYDAPFDPDTENAAIQQFGQTGTGTSLGQAGKYFKQAGLTQNDIDKFMGVTPSKWAGNEAWLRSQAGAEGAEKFKEGMTYIKNAEATANLARATEAARNQLAEEGLPFRSGIEQEGGPSRSYPVDTGTAFEDFRSGIEQEGGSPYSYDMTEEDITADIGGSPYGLDALDLMPSDLDEQRQKTIFRNMFTGKRGPNMYEKMPITTYPHDISASDYTDNFPTGYEKYFGGMEPRDTRNIQTSQTGTRAGPGSFDNFYMNTIGDIVNRGSNINPLPKIGIEFGEWEEDENLNPRLPAWKR